MSTDNRGELLVRLARNSIERAFGATPLETTPESWLEEPGASFVTLTEHGALRGCIGSIEAHRPLLEDVQINAKAAAFEDPRFPSLARDELKSVQVEVSLLSPMAPIDYDGSEIDAIRRLRPGLDGVVLEYGYRRATFLPQVWEQLPEPVDFLRHLKLKAGLRPDFWSPAMKLYRYTVDKWREGAVGVEKITEETTHVCQ